jgi:CRAL/TRIO domain
MAMEAVVWRVKEMHVDDDVMAKGELHALKQERSSYSAEQKAGKDFLAQMRMGKAFVHGKDKLGRPIVTIRVQLHKPGAQSEEALERYIVHVIESVRLTLSFPVETAVSASIPSRPTPVY